MKRIIYGLLLLLTFILQATVFVQYRPFGVVPDFLMIIFVSGALLRGSLFGIELAFIVGIIQDLLVGTFGISIVINISLAYIVGTMENKIVKEQFLVPLVMTFFVTIAHELLYLFLSGQLAFSVPFLWAMKNKIFPLATINALLAIPIYFCLFRLERKSLF